MTHRAPPRAPGEARQWWWWPMIAAGAAAAALAGYLIAWLLSAVAG